VCSACKFNPYVAHLSDIVRAAAGIVAVVVIICLRQQHEQYVIDVTHFDSSPGLMAMIFPSTTA
jgi:hypothetical protein